MLRKFCIFLVVWAILWTLVGSLYIGRVGVSALFKDRKYTFTLTREGLTSSIREVAKLVVLEVQREYEVQDTVSPIFKGPLMVGGRKTVLKFVVTFRLAFDVSRIRPQDVSLTSSGDTLKVEVVLPEPEVMVSVDRWWVVSEEVGIFGTPMRSYEASPVFDYIRNVARSRMKEELSGWYSELSGRIEKVMGRLLTSLLGRPVRFKVKGFRVIPQETK